MTEINKPTGRGRWRKVRNTTLFTLIVGLGIFIAIRFYYPFGEGVKTGQLNYLVYKGVIFKTYEGKLIQSGFYSNSGGGIQSNEFMFSVTDKQIAEELMRAGGQVVELRYKEYFGALPWRGYSKFIVTEIISQKAAPTLPGRDYPPAVPNF